MCNLKTRKRSDDLITESKKTKTDQDTPVSSQSSVIEEITIPELKNETKMAGNSQIMDMVTALKLALKDKEVSDSLISQFRGDCKEMIEQTRIEIIEEVKTIMKVEDEKTAIQDDRLTSLEKWADNTEQEARNQNMVIRGLNTMNVQDERQLASYVATTLSRKLDMKLTTDDIRFVIALGKEKNVNRPVKVAFHDRRARDFIFKKRNLLRGTNIWICDDLTAKRSKLAYTARQAAKQNENFKTWTFEGRVFFKMAEDAEPTRIDDEADLPRHE